MCACVSVFSWVGEVPVLQKSEHVLQPLAPRTVCQPQLFPLRCLGMWFHFQNWVGTVGLGVGHSCPKEAFHSSNVFMGQF